MNQGLKANLPERPADVTSVRLLHVGQADGFDQFRDPDESRPMSTGISRHRQRLVKLAVTREAERLVEMQHHVVVGADVEFTG